MTEYFYFYIFDLAPSLKEMAKQFFLQDISFTFYLSCT